jgi:CheY-like chemotaxis protein
MSIAVNILIVDDDQVNNFVLKNIIKRSYPEAKIEVKMEGQSALNHLKTLQQRGVEFPDVILLDIYMPIMDGFTFLERFLEEFPGQTPSIYMTSSSISREDQQRAYNYPLVMGYITKPLINNNIFSIVNEAVSKKS